ncbi:MAG: peptidyl-prolyl cis-trans isomerase [Deltaproteobacteria bacterium]|nr:peptidyl-prolyl cis-trans isomerase [Deltaproteobacteria bacterium]
MTEELDFSIPTHEGKRAQTGSKLLVILTVIVLIIVLANMCIVLIHKDVTSERVEGSALSAEQLKDLALKLEKQELDRASVAAWKEYLKAASLDGEEAARIWYRIGKIYQADSQYDMALDAFYRSETYARPDDISPEIARRVQESLETMGKFAALRYELADRVGTGGITTESSSHDTVDPVVAEIGTQKITKSDLDRRIERLIETQISQYASYLPEEEADKRKEDMLRQYSTDSQRQIFLNQYMAEEILYRKARESGLMDDPDVRVALRDIERSLLAGKVMEKEFADEIKISSGDLATYYKAHKEEYIQPERASVAHILVENEEEAGDVRRRLEKGDDFSVLAAELSRDEQARETGGEVAEWIEKGEGREIPGLGGSDTAIKAIFATDQGHLVKEDIRTEKGIHIIKVLKREAERQKAFDEVKNEVALALRSQKEREVQQKLFARLKEQYDVVIHQSAFSGADSTEVTADQ